MPDVKKAVLIPSLVYLCKTTDDGTATPEYAGVLGRVAMT